MLCLSSRSLQSDWAVFFMWSSWILLSDSWQKPSFSVRRPRSWVWDCRILPKRVKALVLSPSQHLRQRWERVCSLAEAASRSMMASYFSVTSKMELTKFQLIMPQTQSLIPFITSSSSSFLLAQIFRRSFSQRSPIASRIAFRFSTLSPYACFSKNFRIFPVNSCASRSKPLRSTSEGRIFSQAARKRLKSSRQRRSMRLDSERQTRSQLFQISGNPPLLMELQKNWQSSTNMAGEQGLPLKVFFLMFWKTLPRSSRMSSRKRGRISLSFTCDMFCSLRSSSTGLMSMKQSRSLKKVVRSFRMLFLRATISLLPFCVLRAFSRYSLGVIAAPCSSSRRSAKSRTSQRKLGKQLMISCISRSPLFCNSLLRFVTRLKLCTAFSSMLPTLLQTKQEESSMAIRKILVSVCSPSSSEPSPSVSMTMYWMVGSVGLWRSSGQTHSPLVQALMVGPTSNPEF